MSVRHLHSDTEWMRDAACAGMNQELFFVDQGDHGCAFTAAKKVCARCLVQAECLEFALAENIEVGCWGGTSRRERLKIKKRRRAAS